MTPALTAVPTGPGTRLVLDPCGYPWLEHIASGEMVPVAGDGLTGRGFVPAWVTWLPPGWSCEQWPLGMSPDHVAAFVRHVDFFADPHTGPLMPVYGLRSSTEAFGSAGRLLRWLTRSALPGAEFDRVYPAPPATRLSGGESKDELRRITWADGRAGWLASRPAYEAWLVSAADAHAAPTADRPGDVADSPLSATSSPDEPDGPTDGYGFRLAGVPAEFTKGERRFHRLLCIMWPRYRLRQPVRVEALASDWKQKYGDEAPDPKALGNYCRDLSVILADRFGFPAKVTKDGDCVCWRDA